MAVRIMICSDGITLDIGVKALTTRAAVLAIHQKINSASSSVRRDKRLHKYLGYITMWDHPLFTFSFQDVINKLHRGELGFHAPPGFSPTTFYQYIPLPSSTSGVDVRSNSLFRSEFSNGGTIDKTLSARLVLLFQVTSIY